MNRYPLPDDGPLAVIVSSADGTILIANDAAGRLAGRTVGSLQGRPYRELVHPDDVGPEERQVLDLLKGRTPRYQVTQRWRRADGQLRFMALNATKTGTEGETRIIRRITDVTEQHRAWLERDRFFELSVDGIAVVGFDGRFRRVNPAFLATLGWEADELIGEQAIDLFHPDDVPDVGAARARLLAGHLTATYEARIRARDGSYRWLRAATTAVPDEELTYAWTIDVTERRLAEELLRQREAQLAEAQRIASLSSWELNVETGEISWSNELWRILGSAPRGKATVEEFLARVHPDDRIMVTETTRTPVYRRPPTVEFRIVTPRGDVRTVELRARIDSSVPGGTRVVGTLQDVTQWRATEAALRLSEERFRRLFDEGPTGIVVADTELRFVHVNSAFASMVGRTSEELMGHSVDDVTHPEDGHLGSGMGKRALAGEVSEFQIEKRYVRPDGEIVWGRLITSLLRDDHGRPLYFLSHVEDITEAREAEALRREMSDLKDGFLRVVTHDLGGPLVAIANLARLAAVRTDRPIDEQQQTFARIAGQADRLSRMVVMFLDVARIHRGGVQARRAPVDVADVARRVAERADVRDRCLCLEETPAVAEIDAEQFEHILVNLLDHARNASPPGSRIWLVVRGDGAGGVSVELRHDGPTMPPAERREILSALGGAADGALGSHVGLWVVALFVRLHGGEIQLHDGLDGEPGFRLRLPAVASESHLDEVRK